MAENNGSRLNAALLLYLSCKLLNAAYALGNHDNEVLLVRFLRSADTVDNVLLNIRADLRNNDRGSADSDTRVKGKIAALVAHYLDDHAAAVGFDGVPDPVDHLHDGVKAGVVADSVIGADDIVIYSAGDADAGNASEREITGASE